MTIWQILGAVLITVCVTAAVVLFAAAAGWMRDVDAALDDPDDWPTGGVA